MDIETMSRLAGATAIRPPSAATPPLPPDDPAVERFERALAPPSSTTSSPPVDASPAASAADPGGVGRVGAVARPEPSRRARAATLGDAILDGIDRVSADLSAKWSDVRGLEVAAPADLSPAALLKFQGQLLAFTVQFDLVGKAVSKSAQDLDQMVKMQ